MLCVFAGFSTKANLLNGQRLCFACHAGDGWPCEACAKSQCQKYRHFHFRHLLHMPHHAMSARSVQLYQWLSQVTPDLEIPSRPVCGLFDDVVTHRVFLGATRSDRFRGRLTSFMSLQPIRKKPAFLGARLPQFRGSTGCISTSLACLAGHRTEADLASFGGADVAVIIFLLKVPFFGAVAQGNRRKPHTLGGCPILRQTHLVYE